MEIRGLYIGVYFNHIGNLEIMVGRKSEFLSLEEIEQVVSYLQKVLNEVK